jgi:hypothetical protein
VKVLNLSTEVARMADAAIAVNMARELDSRVFPRRRAVPKTTARAPRRGRWPGGQRPWSADEIERLRELYPSHPQKAVAEMLGRSRPSVASKAKSLGLGDRRRWLPEELARVRELYPNHPTKAIAEELGRSELSVYQAAGKMGLAKDRQFVKEYFRSKPPAAGFIAKQFRKGHAPANKGLRRPGWSTGRMKESQFQKGHRPHTWRPIGTIATDDEGYLRVKVRERDASTPERGWHPDVWPLVHHQTWGNTTGRFLKATLSRSRMAIAKTARSRTWSAFPARSWRGGTQCGRGCRASSPRSSC